MCICMYVCRVCIHVCMYMCVYCNCVNLGVFFLCSIIDYTVSNGNSDPLLSALPTGDNPFREKKACILL